MFVNIFLICGCCNTCKLKSLSARNRWLVCARFNIVESMDHTCSIDVEHHAENKEKRFGFLQVGFWKVRVSPWHFELNTVWEFWGGGKIAKILLIVQFLGFNPPKKQQKIAGKNFRKKFISSRDEPVRSMEARQGQKNATRLPYNMTTLLCNK